MSHEIGHPLVRCQPAIVSKEVQTLDDRLIALEDSISHQKIIMEDRFAAQEAVTHGRLERLENILAERDSAVKERLLRIEGSLLLMLEKLGQP